MASHGRQMPHHHQAQHRHAAPGHGHGHGHGQPVAAAPGVVTPSGTFAPGTKIQVGSHRVIIQKYLSEGGFAHVYLVKMPTPVDGTDTAVLKRVAVPDKDSLRSMRIEVETMKRLKGHRPIVTYIDSHASEMRGGGGYEVFLLMEYCNGGGLIDFMNTRLQHRLTEPEILNIFADIAEGVACMHYLKPALLHRDIKVENVLITSRAGVKRFKLCDFGSASAPRPAPTTVVECRLMDEDVQRHTTLQYRSPEMVDVYRKQPLNEKADIWALGVLLYKLCYYTTPFEDQGQLAILNASYKFPNHPIFSDKLKRLIASTLKESIQSRPNIYQVLAEACSMQGRKVPIHDIYSGKQPSDKSPQKPQSPTKAQVGASVSAPVEKKEQIPDIVPMRRGRPTPSPSPRPQSTASSRKVADGDPFAALDSKSGPKQEADEISSRFPSLDQFSILHEKGGRFNFDGQQKQPPAAKPPKESSQRIADKIADSTFAASRQAAVSPAPTSRPQSMAPLSATSSNSSPVPSGPTSKAPYAPPKAANMRPQSVQSVSSHSTTSRYVSTGTMTSDTPPEQKPLPMRKPVQNDAGSLLGRSSTIHTAQPASTQHKEPALRSVSPEMPKFENVRGYSEYNSGRNRPVSTTFDSRPNHSGASQRAPRPLSGVPEPAQTGESLTQFQERLVADATSASRQAHSQQKALSPPMTDDGKLGNAIKRFESIDNSTSQMRAASPLKKMTREELIPVSESEPSWICRRPSRTDEEGDPEDMTPEMRREMERLQLEEEEQRVAAAQAEYREKISAASQKPKPVPGQKNVGAPPRASSIQNRVQAYLNDEQRESTIQRTAEGYGKYSDAATASSKVTREPPEIKRKPVLAAPGRANSMPQTRHPEPMGGSSNASPVQGKPAAKPPAPKKPTHLNQLPTGGRAISPAKRRQEPEQEQEQLVAVDVPGQPALDWSSKDKDDYLDDFSKRFPSLGAIEGGRE